MQISSRFTIAVHILTCIKYFEGSTFITSDFLAGSIGVNPVIIRRIILQLKSAGMIRVGRGRGGIRSNGRIDDITLYDVYSAVEAVSPEGLFHFHDNPNPECTVGSRIHDILDGSLHEIQKALEDRMRSITIGDITATTEIYDEPNPV